jgi:hypothetical protein
MKALNITLRITSNDKLPSEFEVRRLVAEQLSPFNLGVEMVAATRSPREEDPT